MRRSDDLIAGSQIERPHRDIERVGAVGAGDAVTSADRSGECRLEGVDMGPAH